jgi:hypothetical protein
MGSLRSLIAASAISLMSAGSAHAGLNGTELTGTLTGSTFIPVTEQFSPSSLVVGGGQEFVGSLYDESFKGTYVFNVGFTNDTITLDITGTPNANVSDQDHVTLAGFTLSGFSPLVTNIFQDGGPTPAVNDISYVDSVFTVGFNALGVGQEYTFDIVENNPIPEPGTATVLIAGMVGVLATRRRPGRIIH